jgi:DNA-binding GntR family transcriptional regulator
MKNQLEKIKKIPLREQIINAIRDAIIEGKFKPGEKISEQELSEQLGVSRTPIREAIQILQQQGLVKIVPKSGTYVTDVEAEELKDSLSIRIAIEELALRQAIERSNGEQWEKLCSQLENVLERMQEAADKGSTIEATELDIEWHTHLIDSAQNCYLSRLWRTSGLQYLIWSPERSLYPLAQDKWLGIIYIRHKHFFDILMRKNLDECCREIRLHIEQKYEDLNLIP